MIVLEAIAIAILACVLIAVIAVVRLRLSYFDIVVEGMSMEPTYSNGDHLLVRRGRTGRRGEVVVFTNPRIDGGLAEQPAWLVKRIVAVAGDPVPEDVRQVVADATVPAGRLLVRGDNDRSLDSRRFGYVEASESVGVVVRRLG
jgi:signal peptidase I